MSNALSVLAGFLFVIGFVPYIIAIVRGQTEPAKVTWIIWALLDTITFAGMFAEGAVNGQSVGAVIGAWAVVFLALYYGTAEWKRRDIYCLVGAGLGIVLWKWFDSPSLAIISSLTAVVIGFIPTMEETWEYPEKESRTAWVIFECSSICACLGIPQWTLADSAQPVVFLAIDSVMIYLLFLRRRIPVPT